MTMSLISRWIGRLYLYVGISSKYTFPLNNGALQRYFVVRLKIATGSTVIAGKIR